ncbi:MAG TPA: STAS domain-containing protein [Candidatus Nitrosotalea sp.]|nr:STAS domain-containing protein [Candidatus Nitrosotalea sp.]
MLSADSNNSGLNPYLACSHLAQGRNERGGYYASCELGGPRERAELAARITPARLDTERTLLEGLAAVSEPAREAVVAAALASEATDGASAQSELGAAIESFATQNRHRLQSLGIAPDRFARAFAEWTKARQMPLARLGRMVQETGSDPLRGLWIRLASALEEGEASAGEAAGRAIDCTTTASSPGDAGLEIEAAANRVRLRGQIDRDAWEQLSGLAVMAAALDGDLILDLGGVSFCDVGGLRILLALAEARRERGALILESVPEELARALPALGWNDGSMASAS